MTEQFRIQNEELGIEAASKKGGFLPKGGKTLS